MKLASSLSIPLALVLIFSAAPVTRVMAQEADAAAEKTVEEDVSPQAKAEQLLASIQEQQEAVGQLQSKFERAQGEDQAAIWEQMTGKRRETWKDIEKLYVILLELRKSGTDVGDLEKQTVALAKNISGRLQTEVTALRKTLQELRTTREKTPPEELPDLENLLRKGNLHLNELLQVLLANDQYLEKLGVDPESQFAFLDKTLKERAEAASGRVRLLQEQVSNLAERIKAVGDADAGPLNGELGQLQKRLHGTTSSLGVTVDLMGKREIDAAEYKKLLITSTGEITTDILDPDVAAGLIGDWIDDFTNALIENAPGYLFKVFLFLFILFVFRLLASVVQRVVRRALSHAKIPFSRLLQDFFLMVASRAVMLFGVMIALAQLGVHLGPLLAGLGIAGFVVGFALQETLSNFASGMMILIYRPFDVGDVIQAGGVSGLVSQMNLVSTTILTFDNQKLIVPNTKIWGDVITNVTAEKTRRVDLVFGIGYADDIEHAERVLKEIVSAHELVLKTPEPVVRLHTLGESSVDFIVRPWAKTSDYWSVYWDLTREVKRRFDAEGISIPFPQRDLHVFQEQPPAAPRSDA